MSALAYYIARKKVRQSPFSGILLVRRIPYHELVVSSPQKSLNLYHTTERQDGLTLEARNATPRADDDGRTSPIYLSPVSGEHRIWRAHPTLSDTEESSGTVCRVRSDQPHQAKTRHYLCRNARYHFTLRTERR